MAVEGGWRGGRHLEPTDAARRVVIGSANVGNEAMTNVAALKQPLDAAALGQSCRPRPTAVWLLRHRTVWAHRCQAALSNACTSSSSTHPCADASPAPSECLSLAPASRGEWLSVPLIERA